MKEDNEYKQVNSPYLAFADNYNKFSRRLPGGCNKYKS